LTLRREAILDLLLQLAGVGVLTYDVAPRNVLVSPEGATKIIDFGRVSHPAQPGDRAEWLQYVAKELALSLSDVEAKATRQSPVQG
jgi:RIO-like serine/threonine protein kinase